jgi:mono/diheme cytochrome c family protein
MDEGSGMMRYLLGGSFLAILAGAVAFIFAALGAEAAPPMQPETFDLGAGERLYSENCASCHGINLEGQDDWQSPGADGVLPAPPHDQTGHTWHHGDALFFTYTRIGGKAALAAQGMEFKSGMPGFSEILSDEEIWDILAYIKSTWSERIREVQGVRTQAEQLRGK